MNDPELEAAVKARGITRVCHFTQSRNLPSILRSPQGIMATAYLAVEAPDVLNRNDPHRLDNRPTHISCSIEYPNTWNFKRFRDRESLFTDWVVLLIHPSVLWRSTTYFVPRNAAATGAIHQTGVQGFNALYNSAIRGARGATFTRGSNHLRSCPTDGQAEVLVERSIERDLILAIAGLSKQHVELERGRLALVEGVPDIPWIIAPSFWSGDWSWMIRSGTRPREVPYAPEKS